MMCILMFIHMTNVMDINYNSQRKHDGALRHNQKARSSMLVPKDGEPISCRLKLVSYTDGGGWSSIHLNIL